MTKGRDPLLVRVFAELGAGRITEAFIHDTKAFVDGETAPSGHITVNPVHQTVDTVIHELLHRIEPGWSERYVRNRTTYVRRRMSDAEIVTFYDEYNKRKRTRKARPRDAE